MVSISMSAPNTIVRAALRTLDSDIRTTQNRIATGLKVASYSDNATVWNAASGIRKDVALADNIKSDLAIAKGRADVGSAALKTVMDRLGDLKDKNATAAATTDTAAKTAIAGEMSSLIQQIKAALSSASFQGQNWLSAAGAGAKTINIAFDGGAAVTTSFTAEDIGVASGNLGTLLAATIDGTTAGTTSGSGNLGDAITNAITQVTTYAGKMSGLSKGLDNQLDFLTTLNDIRNKALSTLVDADLEEESAKAKALEVRQQLAYQALAIGNNAAQNILLLFR